MALENFDVSVAEEMKHSLNNPVQLNLVRIRLGPRHTKLSAGTAAGRAKLMLSPR